LPPPPPPGFSDDVVSGTLRVRQGAGRGCYRSGLDALLLATDLPQGVLTRPGAMVLELGAAHGVVALCMALRYPACCVMAVERQPALAALLRHNAAAAGLAPPRLTALTADVRDAAALPRRAAALVLANPPFFTPQQEEQEGGAVVVPTERAAARHELHGGVAAFVAAAAAALAPRGAAKFVLPPSRLPHLLAALEDSTRAHGCAPPAKTCERTCHHRFCARSGPSFD
jgi:tRNA1(Val) A37 N6-methylase TrmN6